MENGIITKSEAKIKAEKSKNNRENKLSNTNSNDRR